jgi:hypothetical protein
MAITEANPGPLWKRLLWMVALWAAGVLAVGLVSGLIHLWLS